MERPILGFHLDTESHWVAELACGHDHHMRHDPPFTERLWVLTPEGRQSRVGAHLDCVRCDRRELPEGYAPYRRTVAFTEASIPEGLRKDHTTKRGVWALLHVSRGRLEYHVRAPFDAREILAPGSPGVVLPEVEHRVAPLGPVEFFVEFWCRRSTGA
jgi:tellurite methyltransferase